MNNSNDQPPPYPGAGGELPPAYRRSAPPLAPTQVPQGGHGPPAPDPNTLTLSPSFFLSFFLFPSPLSAFFRFFSSFYMLDRLLPRERAHLF